MDDNWRNDCLARIELVAAQLLYSGDLPDVHVADPFPAIIDFAIRTGQSLDWLLLGDVRSMIVRMAKHSGLDWSDPPITDQQ